MEVAVVAFGGLGSYLVFGNRVGRAADDLADPDGVVDNDVAWRIRRRTREQRQQRAWRRRWQKPVIVAGEDDRQGFRPLRESRGENLGDHAAHRRPDDVRVLDVEVIEQRRGVGGHVFQRVGSLAGQTEPGPDQPRGQWLSRAVALGLGGQADIAVVVADDAQALRDEPRAEVGPPQQHLGAQAHDQQHRRVVEVTHVLVVQLHITGDRGAATDVHRDLA
ncbi:Uncharacterised protein [Mycobacterium tuberculosis]|nr:Uncharacterised protein [Mycobacterium tuberculosis]CFS61420.1 Uncharacterised protein [Mycobacterium tuberculosis]CKS54712.1 Uncharacterised protein [Mycobacterium tuberculosis]CKT31048.1 Uncharacterised protein [Mycobacterium tuberculosis]